MITAILAEDERELATILQDNLKERGITLLHATDGEEAWTLFNNNQPDILITDVRMPRLDGISLIKRIRASGSEVPIIIVTVNSETEDLERGFDAGADDYLRKPFSLRELAARIKALVRRSGKTITTERQTLSLGKYTLDVAAQRLICRKNENIDEIRNLSHREASILECLILANGDLVENKELLIRFWGSDDVYNLNSLYVFITRLKRYLVADPSIQIVNARSIGYRLLKK